MLISLTEEEEAVGTDAGVNRARVMKEKADKKGSVRKGDGNHTPEQADILGCIAEVAGCKLTKVDYKDPAVWVPWRELDANGNLPPECKRPDILDKYEIRRVERPGTAIKMFDKDLKAGAFVVQAIVGHVHNADGSIDLTGKVKFTVWQDAVEDWKYTHYEDETFFCTVWHRRPIITLPMPWQLGLNAA